MSRIPRATGPDLVAALGKRAFAVLRIRGSLPPEATRRDSMYD